jgi:hypothetical protein
MFQPGHGRHEGDRVVVTHLGLQLSEVAHVVVVHEDIEVPVHLAFGGQQRRGETGVPAHEVIEHVSDGRPLGPDRRLSRDDGAQDVRQTYFDGHGISLLVHVGRDKTRLLLSPL